VFRLVKASSTGWSTDQSALQRQNNLNDLTDPVSARDDNLFAADRELGNVNPGTGRMSLGIDTLALQPDTQTVSGTAISSTNEIVDAAAALIERPNGMVLYPWASATNGFTASITRFIRFRANRPLVVKRIGFNATTAAAGGTNSGADTVQLGIYTATNQSSTTGSDWTRVATTGNATLYTTLTGTTTTTLAATGNKYAALTANYTLTPGQVYYAAIAYSYPASANTTNCSIAALTFNLVTAFGNTVSNAETCSQAVATLPTNMASVTFTTSVAPAFILSTA
jgi:hypothetical protein